MSMQCQWVGGWLGGGGGGCSERAGCVWGGGGGGAVCVHCAVCVQ